MIPPQSYQVRQIILPYSVAKLNKFLQVFYSVLTDNLLLERGPQGQHVP